MSWVRTVTAGLPHRLGAAGALRPLLAALTLGVLGWVVVPDFLDSGASFADVQWWWLLPAVILEMISLATFVRLRRRLLQSGGRRLPLRRVGAVTLAGNAISVTAPAGPALSAAYVYGQMRRLGVNAPLVAWTLVAGGVLSAVGFAAVAVGGTVLAGSATLAGVVGTAAGSVVAATAVVVGLTVVTHHPGGLARAADGVWRHVPRRLRERGDGAPGGPGGSGAPGGSGTGQGTRPVGVATPTARFVADVTAIAPRRRDWAVALGLATLNWAADLASFLLCLHAVGVGVASFQVAVLAYTAGMATSGLSVLPGGLGGLEAAMLVTLTHGGVVAGSAAAGVLTYRLIAYVFVAALGWAAWWVLRRRRSRDGAGAVDEAWTTAPAVEGAVRQGPLVAAA